MAKRLKVIATSEGLQIPEVSQYQPQSLAKLQTFVCSETTLVLGIPIGLLHGHTHSWDHALGRALVCVPTRGGALAWAHALRRTHSWAPELGHKHSWLGGLFYSFIENEKVILFTCSLLGLRVSIGASVIKNESRGQN